MYLDVIALCADAGRIAIATAASTSAETMAARTLILRGMFPPGLGRPSDEELDHDYLWRTAKALPERGRIGIFNRSYYEEVLVVRVHPEILAGQKLPASLVTRRVWTERYDDINAFERYLARYEVEREG